MLASFHVVFHASFTVGFLLFHALHYARQDEAVQKQSAWLTLREGRSKKFRSRDGINKG